MSDTSRRNSCSKNEDWILVIGALPINGHQNAWRAVKDLLKRLPTGSGSPYKDHVSAKIQQVHIFTTVQGRYAVCRFSQSQQARNAFDWIGGNIWHGARIGAWLYRVGSEFNSSAILVDNWEHYPFKSTPLEAFWGIGNAFLQRTPTAGPVSPTMRAVSPTYSSPPQSAISASPVEPFCQQFSDPYRMPYQESRRVDYWQARPYRVMPTKRRKQVSPWRTTCRELNETTFRRAHVFAEPVICNGSDEPVPYANTPFNGAILVS